jgi:hypothetical protein
LMSDPEKGLWEWSIAMPNSVAPASVSIRWPRATNFDSKQRNWNDSLLWMGNQGESFPRNHYSRQITHHTALFKKFILRCGRDSVSVVFELWIRAHFSATAEPEGCLCTFLVCS